MADQSNIQCAASKSIRPFKSSEEYLYAMKEDLAEWLNGLYDLDITADTFMESLETGCALCCHSNNVNRTAHEFLSQHPDLTLLAPRRDVVFQSRNVVPGSFVARDNVSNFIGWCRHELRIKDVLMFETNDLVERCNEKNFVLCLLEVARRGAKFGMPAPMLVQLEEEIEKEIRDQENLQQENAGKPNGGTLNQEKRDSSTELINSWKEQKRILCDLRNLDELVREILGQCSCPAQFPMTKISEGKYKVGDSSALIFIRVLRAHVMVRVGGGWDTLEHYLDKHDPCRCNAYAHRYQQSKSSGQAPHSKNSSAHSSRSASPGPHYKPPERRSLEPSAPCPPSSSSSSSPRLTRASITDAESNRGRTNSLLPKVPRDGSEPRQVNPVRNKETLSHLTRRLSADSDSSTASSKGGGVGGGGRLSLGPRRGNGEEVVLLVNRKEGKHEIERAGGGAGQLPAVRHPQPRTRSTSRERPNPTAPSSPRKIKPCPPQGSTTRYYERGRSLGPDGPRRLQASRSLSQGKTPQRVRAIDGTPTSPRHRETQDDPRSKQASSGSPRLSGSFSKRQMPSSTSSSPVKGITGSPMKKSTVNPRPPAPRSPSVGNRRLLPPISQQGRRSPHATSRTTPRSPHHHSPRSPRSPRPSGRPTPRGWGQQNQSDPQDELGLGFSLHSSPAMDPKRELELYRSFEAEFLANTGQTKDASMNSQHGFRLSGDSNVADSAYSSSNSSSSSLNVGGKIGLLPELRETRRISAGCALEDPPALLHSQTRASLCNGGFRKLPAISSSMEEGDLAVNSNQLHNGLQINRGHREFSNCVVPMDAQVDWDGLEGDVPLDNHEPDLPYDQDLSKNIPLPDPFPSPPPPEDYSYNDSASDSSSMCLSLSEPISEGSCSPKSSVANGEAEGTVVLRAKRGQNKADRVPSIYKLKLRPRVRPRTDNRPDNSPSRIPTPLGYRARQQRKTSGNLTPPQSPRARKNLHQAFGDVIHQQRRSASVGSRERSFSPESSLDPDAWM